MVRRWSRYWLWRLREFGPSMAGSTLSARVRLQGERRWSANGPTLIRCNSFGVSRVLTRDPARTKLGDKNAGGLLSARFYEASCTLIMEGGLLEALKALLPAGGVHSKALCCKWSSRSFLIAGLDANITRITSGTWFPRRRSWRAAVVGCLHWLMASAGKTGVNWPHARR